MLCSLNLFCDRDGLFRKLILRHHQYYSKFRIIFSLHYLLVGDLPEFGRACGVRPV